MKADVLFFLCLAALLGAASGMSVGPVRLVNDQKYLLYRDPPSENTSLIECPYQLAAGEEVNLVYWEMWDGNDQVGAYEWSPVNGGQEATGRLEGVVDLNRDDGGLQLTELRYNLRGDYLCAVELTNGQRSSSSKEEVLVVDTSAHSSEDFLLGQCFGVFDYTSAAVYPEPTVRAGMFSREINQYYENVTEWTKTLHRNGSVTCSFESAYFEVDESTPKDAVFMIEQGVSKSDGTYLPMMTSKHFLPIWNELGCPAVKEEDHKEVFYLPMGNAICRGYKERTRATVTCQDGYQPVGEVSEVEMRCNGPTFAWELEEGTTATLDDLQCENGSKAVVSSGWLCFALLFTSLFESFFISGRP